ncbi:peptidoglycan-binding domain-containing protein [Paracoccus sediminicola]|uniref:peptidoglycan-binding domain-containing protein n=1 Tax=Paracoccus sediminicola TaxID=3017783 RepID=UPI0022F0C115|nr:peptidoglycan-binding domain-containing protein [Paracoccus sediminicola]WBU57647.1 peptidoglycan-binding domain-containing protein [Paracoccus sediminicola]
MKPIVLLALGTALPGMALAEDVFIRVEAKRGAQAVQQAAASWQSRVADLPVVTFPVGQSWTAIAFGPLPREEAEAQMAALKEARTIPSDSLLSPAEGLPATPFDASAVSADTAAAQDDRPQGENAANGASDASTAGVVPAPAPEPIQPEPPSPDHYLRLEAFQDRSEADAALNRWRETLPEAGLWEMPNGWFTVAIGPFSEQGAGQWLAALRGGGTIPEDSLVEAVAEMGRTVVEGSEPGWPLAPENPPEMPPMAEVQKALSWAGFYDGAIDGQSGPKTRAAIAAELGAQRETPDAATAMLKLMERRDAWRAEMGLTTLDDDYTGLSVTAPMERLTHDRDERALSIYGPKDESGAALILFSQPGGQQEMEDLAGLVTALGWVPSPEREIGNGTARLSGRNETHIGRSESRIAEGRVEGWVLIWPVEDAANAPRIAAEIADSFTRSQPPRAERAPAIDEEAEATSQDAAAAEDSSGAPNPLQ